MRRCFRRGSGGGLGFRPAHKISAALHVTRMELHRKSHDSYRYMQWKSQIHGNTFRLPLKRICWPPLSFLRKRHHHGWIAATPFHGDWREERRWRQPWRRPVPVSDGGEPERRRFKSTWQIFADLWEETVSMLRFVIPYFRTQSGNRQWTPSGTGRSAAMTTFPHRWQMILVRSKSPRNEKMSRMLHQRRLRSFPRSIISLILQGLEIRAVDGLLKRSVGEK